MSLLTHLAITVSYGLMAAAVAFGLPQTVLAIERPTAFVAGITLFLGAALVHEIFSRRLDTDDLAEEVHDLRVERAEAAAALEAMEEKLVRLEEAGGEQTSKDLIAELRLLKSLLAKLAATSADRRPLAEMVRPGAPGSSGEPAPMLLPDNLSGAEILGMTRAALEENRVDLYLQPVVSLPQRKPKYYEAFSRIRSEDGGMIVPEQYLPVASDSGLISTIDNILLFRCVQMIRRARKHSLDVGFICNISSHTLADTEYFTEFTDFMEQNNDLARSLIFEMSQSELEDCGPDVRAQLDRLAELGFHFSIDRVTNLDFDFDALQRRRFRFIKVEADILLSRYEQSGAPVDAVDLTERMKRSGIHLIAEKIEAERTVPELLEFNVEFGQGYLFGEPRRAREDVA